MSISIAQILEALGQVVQSEFPFLSAVYPLTQFEGIKIWNSNEHLRYDHESHILNFNAHLGEYVYFKLHQPVKYVYQSPQELKLLIPLRLVMVGAGRSDYIAELALRRLLVALDTETSVIYRQWDDLLTAQGFQNLLCEFVIQKSYLGLNLVMALERPDLANTPNNWDSNGLSLFAMDIELKLTTRNNHCQQIEWGNCCFQ